MIEHIRNFSIIAHIDHGKSTLADRMLEITGTVEKRKMREQVLDQMDLERERGITIKMQPVRMNYSVAGTQYTLNLIDTPGHIDFSYEVSRALHAVEGTILLVDATQGVQAQTLSVLALAREQKLPIIPVLNKIDMAIAEVPKVRAEVAKLLDCNEEEIILVSGKTGEGVAALLDAVVARIPPPTTNKEGNPRGLIFDFSYSTHRGVLVYLRMFDGTFRKGDKLTFLATGQEFGALGLGIFKPQEIPVDMLSPGEIGCIVTGIKEPGRARVGDTIVLTRERARTEPLVGYMAPKPVVWASVYPEEQDDFKELKLALERLQLSDSSLSFEEETSGTIGRGFRCGFLGMLHMEIVTERLRREFNLELIVATPTISYEIEQHDGTREVVYSAAHFPDDGTVKAVYEPWVAVTLITPPEYVGGLVQLFHDHEVEQGATDNFSDDRVALHMNMPLRELMRNFFDEVKSVSSGFASLSYEQIGVRIADIVRLDVLVADERIPAFSRVVSRRKLESQSEEIVERLEKLLPRQLFEVKIQAKAMGRIIAARRISAMRKDVTGYLYGGDITRKKKLLEKQKKGKKRMKQSGKVNIPHDVFLKITRAE